MLLYHNIFLENWTRAILGKDQVWFVEVLIHNQVFHNKLLNDLCAFLLNVLFLQSAFRFYSLYHVMIEVCCQNVSSKKYEQLNFLFKINKRTPLFDKRALRLSRVTVGDWIPPKWQLFLTILNQTKKKFLKRDTFEQSFWSPATLTF